MTHRPVTTVAAAAATALLTLVTGCTTNSSQAAPVVKTDTPAPRPGPTQPDPKTDAAQRALAAYAGYNRLYEDAAQKADERIAGLEKYAHGQALFQARHDMRVNRIDNVVYRGRDTFAPRVTQVSLDQSPKRVVISDCVDGSAVHLVNRRTGKRIQIVDPQGRPTKVRRHPGLAWVDYLSGGWYVTRADVRPDKTC
jgi:hypothetical protein